MRVSLGLLDKVGRSYAFDGHTLRGRTRTVKDEREGRSARRVRQRIPESGPAEEDFLHPRPSWPIFRLGSIIPTPNVNVAAGQTSASRQATTGDQQGLYSLINLFSGGALLQLAIFALGIMPYITASIILQLLTVVIPRLEALKKEGQSGQTKITQYTRYLTLVLAVLNSTAFVTVAVNDRLFTGCTGHRLQQGHLPGRRDDPDHDRRHQRHHVAGRADHRARRRQRHVGDDLHPDRRDLPDRAVEPQGRPSGLAGLGRLPAGASRSAWS